MTVVGIPQSLCSVLKHCPEWEGVGDTLMMINFDVVLPVAASKNAFCLQSNKMIFYMLHNWDYIKYFSFFKF